MTQAEAATLFGVTQPRISNLMGGKIDLFSLDTLMDIATTAGVRLHVEVCNGRRSKGALRAS